MGQAPEYWAVAPGFEGRYEVSNRCRLRSVRRTVTCRRPNGRLHPRKVGGRLLTVRARRGHGVTTLWAIVTDSAGRTITLNVSKLAAQVFSEK